MGVKDLVIICVLVIVVLIVACVVVVYLCNKHSKRIVHQRFTSSVNRQLYDGQLNVGINDTVDLTQ